MNLSATRIFICYSHLDKEILNELKRHLKPFEKDFEIWDDQKLEPGMLWKDEIAKAIEKCNIAIILISADFLASDFIHTDELPNLLKAAEIKGTAVLCLYVGYCHLDHKPEITRFQFVNDRATPIYEMEKPRRERIYVHTLQTALKLSEKNSFRNESPKIPESTNDSYTTEKAPVMTSQVIIKVQPGNKDNLTDWFDIWIDDKHLGFTSREKPFQLKMEQGNHYFYAESDYIIDDSVYGGSSNFNEISEKLFQNIEGGKTYEFECGYYDRGFWRSHLFDFKLTKIY